MRGLSRIGVPRSRKIGDDRHRKRVGSSRGQSVVEFALILPVLLLTMLTAVDFGRLFFTTIQLTNAAREGVNYAAQHPTDTVTIQSRVDTEANTQAQRGEGAITVSTACKDSAGISIACSLADQGNAAAGNIVAVSTSEPFSFLTPFMNGFFGGGLQVGSTASAVVLGYAPGAGTNPGTCSAPVASFTMIINDLTVTVNPSASTPNSGVCNISGYNWDWGDGNTDVGSATGASHTYAVPRQLHDHPRGHEPGWQQFHVPDCQSRWRWRRVRVRSRRANFTMATQAARARPSTSPTHPR